MYEDREERDATIDKRKDKDAREKRIQDWLLTLAHELPEGARREAMVASTVFPQPRTGSQNAWDDVERAYSDEELVALAENMDELPDGTVMEHGSVVPDVRVPAESLDTFPRSGILCTVPEAWFEPHTRERAAARYSFSGAQDKFTAVLEKTASGAHVLRTADRNRELGNVIVKPYSFTYPFQPENEYFCMRVLELCGFGTARTALFRARVPGGMERLHLCCERFDLERELGRPHRKTVRQVAQLMDLPAVSGGKYSITTEELFGFLRERLSGRDMMEFSMGYVFGYILGNGDMHAKNFSAFVAPDGTCTLTPFYDMVNTLTYDLPQRLCLPIGEKGTHRPDPLLLADLVSDSLGAEGFEELSRRLSALPEAVREATEEIRSAARDVGAERFRSAREAFLTQMSENVQAEGSRFLELIRSYYLPGPSEPLP